MRTCGIAVVVAALGLATGCTGGAATVSPAIPPAAPAELTTPPSEDEDDDEDEDLDEDAGFGGAAVGDKTAKPATPPAPTARMKAAAAKLVAHSKGNTAAWDRLAEMTDRYGHRLSGSKALEDAIDWSLATMKADGLANVRKENVMVPHWVRGKESLRVTAPFKRNLDLIGLGMSVGTRGTLRAEVTVVDHVDAIAKQPAGALKGKIVLINQVMPAYDHAKHDSHYGPAVQARLRGASEAAKLGAVAVLVRSVTARSLGTVHTGSLSYEDGVKKIPAAAVTHAGAELLARQVARGRTTLELKMGARMLPDAASGNAIAELVGREQPDEVVVIGGHIDSWDVGDGASDDGAGCLIAMEAARMLKELDLVPRRTIRVVLFTNEENGLRGAKGYFEAHGDEHHVAAIESDAGMGAPYGFGVVAKDAATLALVASYGPLFQPLGADHIAAGWGGADISPLTKQGVLSLSVHPDTSHYFDLHHSPADTIDKIDPKDIQGNAAALALMAYILAERA